MLTLPVFPPDFRLRRFRTRDFAAGKRLAAWSAIMAERLLGLDIEPFANRPFAADVMMRASNDVRIAMGEVGESVSTRTPELVGADNDDAMLLICLEGRIKFAHGRHSGLLQKGDGLLFGCRELMSFTIPIPVRVLLLRLPAVALARCGSPSDLSPLRYINRSTSELKLLIRYCTALFEEDQVAMRPGASLVVVDHVVDLVALVIGTPRAAPQLAAPRGDASTLHAIKADILRNLTSRKLSPQWIADRHKLSVRQLYRLFERGDDTFAAFVMEGRLAGARDMILNPRFRNKSIGEIAVQAGFDDVSYFNRRFRAKFGTTPTQVRAARDPKDIVAD